MSERVRSRPYVWQPVPWTEGQVLTRGSVDGLPALTWGRADRSELATVRQLRDLGLRPAGAEPVAVLVFGHRAPDGPRPAIEYASLYRISEAAPKRTATEAQRAAIDKALTARRTCRDYGVEQDYYLPTSERRCWPCAEAAEARDHHDDAQDGELGDRGAVFGVGDDESDRWRVVHDAAMRAEDYHRPVTEHDVTEADLTEYASPECALDDPGADGDSVAIPAQRTGPPAAAPIAETRAEPARDAHKLDPLDEKNKSPEATAEPVRVEHNPATTEETAAAVERAQHALARIAQQRTDTRAELLAGAERASAGQLSRWHADDRATAPRHDRGGEHTDELERITP